VEYTGRRNVGQCCTESYATTIAGRYRINSTVKVYYNPQDPSTSLLLLALLAKKKGRDYLLFILGAVCAFFALKR